MIGAFKTIMIQLKEITFRYPNHIPILEEFSWQVKLGEAWAVLGPSGCGKSTLLYLLAGLRTPQHGEVYVGGKSLTGPRPQTGLILQDYGLLPWATVEENASLGLRLRQFYGPDGRHAPTEKEEIVTIERARRWLARLGLQKHANKYPAQISGGQRQRTAIARTLALHPDLLLMDEPFASLDAPTRQNLGELIRSLHQEHHLTTVTVTHTIEEAALLGERILVLSQPPNTTPQVVENPLSAKPNFIETSAFLNICTQLRGMLECSL
jgi:NitT/TauT family transport system ATP-binding protein